MAKRALPGSALKRLWQDERGTVTAEFALVLPAVLVVLGIVIGGILIAAHRITLVSTAGEIARLEARGDEDLARDRVASLSEQVTVRREQRERLHCVELSSRPGGGILSSIVVSVEACAISHGGSQEGDR